MTVFREMNTELTDCPMCLTGKTRQLPTSYAHYPQLIHIGSQLGWRLCTRIPKDADILHLFRQKHRKKSEHKNVVIGKAL